MYFMRLFVVISTLIGGWWTHLLFTLGLHIAFRPQGLRNTLKIDGMHTGFLYVLCSMVLYI